MSWGLFLNFFSIFTSSSAAKANSSLPLHEVLRLLARSSSSTLTAGASQAPQMQNPLAQQQCRALGQLFPPPLGDN